MKFDSIGVVGFGTMGSGVVVTAVSKGLDVKVFTRSEDSYKKGLAQVEGSLARFIKKGLLPDGASDYIKRCSRVTEFKEFTNCDFVLEAVPESKKLKREIFKKLDAELSSEITIASNTSSVSITEISDATSHPGRVIGMHFMNPVPLMPLVEIIQGKNTNAETLAKAKKLAEILGKTAVEVKDSPGFAINRLLIPQINEACFAVMEGISDANGIDTVMKLGASHPMGPLALGDLIGLDIVLAIMESLHQGFGDDKYRPCPLLAQMVRDGKLGRKTGQGFFDYAKRA